MKPYNRPKAVLKTLSALSILLPTTHATAAEMAREIRPNTASSRAATTSTDKKKENEKTKMDIREFEKALLEKGIPIRESFGDGHDVVHDVRCTG